MISPLKFPEKVEWNALYENVKTRNCGKVYNWEAHNAC
jgi:hypothetical protein